jgi:hypothetical protein
VPRHQPLITLNDGTRLLRLRRRFPRAEQWGLYAFADPSIVARQAPVFWHAASLRQVVRLRAAPPKHRHGLTPLTLSRFNADRVAAIGVDNIPLVLMKGRGLVVVEIRHRSHDTPLASVFEIDGFADLNAHRTAQRLPFTEREATAANRQALAVSTRRSHHALIALDESLGGKTYRQIAITIFGEKKVAEEWQGPSQFLKDRTRRLVAKGTELMKGGYRDLLA